MNEVEFQAYLDFAVEDLADQHVRAGNWHASEAPARAAELIRHMLPDGLTTENHHLFSVLDEESGARVGLIWLMLRYPGAHASLFVCGFCIFEQYRRQGFGTQTLLAVEERARGLGIDRIGFHVFAHNRAALALYERAGYRTTGLFMAQDLDEQSRRVSG
jgi:ribosomal protein S18 acetylase RimI-like enzyme